MLPWIFWIIILELECEKACCITCIAIRPGARKVIKGNPKISPLSFPIASESTNKNSSEVTKGEITVWTATIKNLKTSFLSGTFYSIDRLPDILKNVSEINPFFYIIDGFRYGFLGAADGSIQFGLFYLLILSFITWFAAYMLFKKGYKIKS